MKPSKQIIDECLNVHCPVCHAMTSFPCNTVRTKNLPVKPIKTRLPHTGRIASRLRQLNHIVDGYVSRKTELKHS